MTRAKEHQRTRTDGNKEGMLRSRVSTGQDAELGLLDDGFVLVLLENS